LNNKAFHILIIIVLVVVGLVIFRILAQHYWLLFFIWIMLPFFKIWFTSDSMRESLSQELQEISKKVLIGTAVILSIFNFVNSAHLRHEVGRQFIDGYRTEISHDCEAPEGPGGSIGTPPETCLVEDLSRVEWYGQFAVYILKWGGFILVFLVPAATMVAGEKVLGKKIKEK
jgi:hypothetical protein